MSVASSGKTEHQLSQRLKSNVLKIALFATGLAGIVAEYVLSTLATYFLGDSVFQWTMIVSMMLFSMGLGSRLSKLFEQQLLQKFIYVEFTLSILSAFAALLAYTAAAYTVYTGFIIYGFSILIGLLIGLEIPLVIRLNDEFEELKVNVSSVMEKDYYGSLLGGIFFAFIGLPYLGLTYTPFILGITNFLVALLLLLVLWSVIEKKVKRSLGITAFVVACVLVSGLIFAEPIILYGEQQRYKDKIIYQEQSRYQRIVMTQWKEHYWLFINGNQQLSTLDEQMYHEPLVHPAMKMLPGVRDVLVLGGGDGCAVREILKYSEVKNITLVDLDPAMTKLGKNHPVLKTLNQGALHHEKVKVVNQDAFHFLENTHQFFDVIIIDLPDPNTVELGRLYSSEFYTLASRQMRPQGVLITQAGSPYFATKAFHCINKTMESAGFQTQAFHNQVLTMGEWGWVLGLKTNDTTGINLKARLQSLTFQDIETAWLNQEAMQLMTSFGKDFFLPENDSIEVNTVHHPVLYRYYLDGNWDIY
ncbi:polyamine aminopropyltransferase [Catalinimonas niigatensis]|uniref:polyamine aminopropyltransferase n=1 Tax=Catalinimonas niigatensis TaxID=1397264 RepID=UPI00266600CD|nr:polyamine aminopropyltransferase [Catalinimonas niigatensis]WPP50571.1 polyamine aminopropyltransferase [Catalinimonas niigatensis]